MGYTQKVLITALLLAFSPAAGASDDSYPGADEYDAAEPGIGIFELGPHSEYFDPFGLFGSAPRPLPQPKLEPSEEFSRAQSLLRYLGVPEEADSQALLSGFARLQNLRGVQALLQILDPTGTFRRFLGPLSMGSVDAFQDLRSHQVADFSVPLSAGAPDQDSLGFHQRLLKARANPASRPLAGLRIAIDPGHMGGDFWDRETGKQIRDRQGHKLSEGVLNLQVALLLEKSFTALGAEVRLTHRELAPVSPVEFLKMEVKPRGLRRVRDTTLAGGFQQLLNAGPAGSRALYAAADASPYLRKIFADTRVNRDEYFIRGEDLIARSEAIEAFDADIALVIHFDVAVSADNPNGVNTVSRNGTKTYVPGQIGAVELSSRTDRAFLAKHLLDAASWQASLDLGRHVVHRLHDDLKVPYSRGGGGSSKEIEPGIFSRNLAVSRRVSQRAMTYVECLFYNDPSEFKALIDARHPMQISGESHPYSDRLVEVARAIRGGVLDFVAGYGD